MNTPEYQPLLPPEGDCPHGADAWTLCEPCLAEILDDNAILGKFDLMGVSAGLAVDLHEDGEVTIYTLHALNVAYGSGGVSYAWVTHDEWLTTEPHVVIAEATEPVTMAAQEAADFCEIASGLASALRPVVARAVELDAPEALFTELVRWLAERGAKARAQRLVLHVAQMLALALIERESQEVGL